MENTRQLRRHLSSSSEEPAIAASMVGDALKKGQRIGLARSVYGGAGGHNTRISVARYVGGPKNVLGGELFTGNEKAAMQNLNDRLASYLEKVRSLEQSNASLELKVKQWYEANSSSSPRDYSAYYKQIEDLRKQIKDAEIDRARCVLKIDNARLALEDFRIKYETERSMCISVETDVQGLSKVFDDLTLRKTDLEVQIEEITKDLALLKKEHEEEVGALRGQMNKSVTVEVDAAPGKNLGAIMNEMRQKYEAMAQENLKKAKEQFDLQIGSLQQEVTLSTEELKEAESQVKVLKQTYQTSEIELRSLLNMKESLEQTLEDTNMWYGEQYAAIQLQLNSLKQQLIKIKNDSEQHMKEYEILLDIKTRLEQEIATYRRLLEGEEISTIRSIEEIACLNKHRPTVYGVKIACKFGENETLSTKLKKTRKIKTVVEEVVDGKVVSSEVREMEEDM
ncbi:keratin, type I cytoskeletal 20 [Sorex fumeus]|uniref:keratin, type I cytoskeletal 20 n=1 Tax=Sorex fumeus TaxID=62283 RepID=UPI0024ADED64|nr:keratin, type I cytoskeletal 20 [Sorex fumeus]